MAPLTQKTKLTLNDLTDYFVRGCKSPDDQNIGVEWEKIGVYKDTARAIPYFGDRGVLKIFQLLSQKYSWEPVEAGGFIIALKKNNASITLEPGGQIELSGQKASKLSENVRELECHLNEIRMVSEGLGITWLGIGAQPFSVAEDIEWVPKERYGIMREVLKDKGALTYSMMKETASIQISLDYLSEEDAIEKLRLALGLSPILSSIFANSPIVQGQPSGYLSRRAHIWLHTAPDRSGTIEDVYRKDFGFKDYVDYALKIPMFFIARNEKMILIKNTTFAQFMRKGYGDFVADEKDWALHLSTIFTEARLKNYLEIRCIDCQKGAFAASVPALIKGIFYDDLSRKKSWELIADLSLEERRSLSLEAPKTGLDTKLRGSNIWPLAEKLIQYAEEGLLRINKDETKYLEPIKNLICDQHSVPANILLRCFSKGFTEKEKIAHVLKCAAIQ